MNENQSSPILLNWFGELLSAEADESEAIERGPKISGEYNETACDSQANLEYLERNISNEFPLAKNLRITYIYLGFWA